MIQALADGWAITRRNLIHWTRQPGQVVVGLLFPVLLVLMFGYLLGGGMAVPGGGDYRECLLPGLFALTMLFGVETTFAAVAHDARRAVTDRFRSIPMARSGIVLGRGAADLLHAAAGLLVMILCGLAAGWRWHGGAAGAAVAVALLLWLRVAMLGLGIWLGLLSRNPELLAAVQILVWPVGFLSSAVTFPATMPAWLGAVADANPLSATANAARMLSGNPAAGGDSWAAQHPVLLAALWPAALVAIFFPLAVHRFRRLDRCTARHARARNRRSIRGSVKPTARAAASTVAPCPMRYSARSTRSSCW
jgi:ABC-2 type transport system permease protein